MKVSYEVDWRSKFRFYLQVFFDFLDISVVDSKVVYDKIQSLIVMSSSVDFWFSLACSIIRNFWNRIRAVPTSRPSKRSKGEKAITADHLPQIAATHARCAYCSANKVKSCIFICCLSCNISVCLQEERSFLSTSYNPVDILKIDCTYVYVSDDITHGQHHIKIYILCDFLLLLSIKQHYLLKRLRSNYI